VEKGLCRWDALRGRDFVTGTPCWEGTLSLGRLAGRGLCHWDAVWGRDFVAGTPRGDGTLGLGRLVGKGTLALGSDKYNSKTCWISIIV